MPQWTGVNTKDEHQEGMADERTRKERDSTFVKKKKKRKKEKEVWVTSRLPGTKGMKSNLACGDVSLINLQCLRCSGRHFGEKN